MNSHEHLSDLIDQQRNGHPTVPQTPEEYFAVDLLNWAESLTPSAALDTKFAQKMGRTKRSPLRWVAASAAALLMVGTLILTVPPLRAFAQSILQQFGLLTVTDAPSPYEEWAALPTVDPASTPIPGITPQAYEMRNLSLEAVEALAGFTVLEPRYVPTGYVRGSRDVWQRNGMNSVSTGYYHPNSSVSFNLAQTIYVSGEHDFAIGDADSVSVEVRGMPGLWVEQMETWPPGSTINMLVWQEGDFTFILQSATTHGRAFDQAEMMRIAESLG